MTNRVGKAPRLLALVLLALVACSGQPARAQVESREGDRAAEPDPGTAPADAGAAGSIGTGRRQPDLSRPRRLSTAAAGSSDLVAQLLSRVDALEEQVRQLRGRIDETQNQVQRQGAESGQADRGHGVPDAEPAGGARRRGPSPGPRRRTAAACPAAATAAGQSGIAAAVHLARGTAAAVRRRSGARRNWRSRRAMPHWRGATIRPPNRRRARC